MTKPTEIIRSFYHKLKAGDAPGALGLMAHDIEWLLLAPGAQQFPRPRDGGDDIVRPDQHRGRGVALNSTEQHQLHAGVIRRNQHLLISQRDDQAFCGR